MFGWIKRIVKREPPPFKAWAVFDAYGDVWVKVVSQGPPTTMYPWRLVGPFRSEIDCEDYCDRANTGLSGKYRLYNEQHAQE